MKCITAPVSSRSQNLDLPASGAAGAESGRQEAEGAADADAGRARGGNTTKKASSALFLRCVAWSRARTNDPESTGRERQADDGVIVGGSTYRVRVRPDPMRRCSLSLRMFFPSLAVLFSSLIETVRLLGDTSSIIGSRRDRYLEYTDNSRVSPPAGTEKRKPGGAQCTRDAKLSNLVSLRHAVHHGAVHPRSMCSEHSGMHTYTRLTD
jgi:hypothetical protein